MAKPLRYPNSGTTCGDAAITPSAAHNHEGNNIMATLKHPETGVELNIITVKRPRNLTRREIETARLLRADGNKVQDIAAMLGTNQGRIQEALGLGGEEPVIDQPDDTQPRLI